MSTQAVTLQTMSHTAVYFSLKTLTLASPIMFSVQPKHRSEPLGKKWELITNCKKHFPSQLSALLMKLCVTLFHSLVFNRASGQIRCLKERAHTRCCSQVCLYNEFHTIDGNLHFIYVLKEYFVAVLTYSFARSLLSRRREE